MADYQPKDDIEVLVECLSKRYGSLEKALNQLDDDAEIDLEEFERWLKQLGLAKSITAANVVNLFDYIDGDFNHYITVDELFNVLKLPALQLQRRQKEQRERDINRIYEIIADRIRASEFKTIEEYFSEQLKRGALLGAVDDGTASAGNATATTSDSLLLKRPSVGRRSTLLVTPPSPTALAPNEQEGSGLDFKQFVKLVGRLGVAQQLGGEQLTNERLKQVFSEIDKDKTGSVSISELQQALQDYIVRDTLADIAEAITGDSKGEGSLDIAFSKLPKRTESPQNDGVEDLKHLLRRLCEREGGKRLKVIDQDGTLRMLHDSLQPFSLETFKQRLQAEHDRVRSIEQQRQDEEKRKKDERKERARREFRVDNEAIVEKVVSDWVANGKALESDDMAKLSAHGDFTKEWSISARAGQSRSQLRDYVRALEDHTKEAAREISLLEEKVADLQGNVASDAISSCATPSRPKSPHSFVRLDSTLVLKSKAIQAEKLIQAVASGSLHEVQRLLSQNADLANSIAWGGVTPLMTAARHGHEGIMRCLFASRADLDRTDAYGRTAADHAFRRPDTLAWLRARGAPTGKELALEAEALAQRVLEIEAEKARLQAVRDKLEGPVLKRNLSRNMPRAGEVTPATPAALRSMSPRSLGLTTTAAPYPNFSSPFMPSAAGTPGLGASFRRDRPASAISFGAELSGAGRRMPSSYSSYSDREAVSRVLASSYGDREALSRVLAPEYGDREALSRILGAGNNRDLTPNAGYRNAGARGLRARKVTINEKR